MTFIHYDWCPYKKGDCRHSHRRVQRKDCEKTQREHPVEIGVMRPQPAWGIWGHQELEGAGSSPTPLQVSGGAGPADTLISNFPPPEW